MRRLTEDEMSALLASDGVAHLATVDDAGYPHVTPIWFLWSDPVIHLTSWVGRPHLQRIETNPRVGLVIDVEEEQRGDGQRPNRQIRIRRLPRRRSAMTSSRGARSSRSFPQPSVRSPVSDAGYS